MIIMANFGVFGFIAHNEMKKNNEDEAYESPTIVF